MYSLPITRAVALFAAAQASLNPAFFLSELATRGRCDLSPLVHVTRQGNRHRIVDPTTEHGDEMAAFLPPTVAATLPCSQPGYTRFDGAGQVYNPDAARQNVEEAAARQWARDLKAMRQEKQATHARDYALLAGVVA